MENGINIASFIIGIVGTASGIVGVYLTIRSNKKNKQMKNITWNDLLLATKYFYKKLQQQNYVPDIIVTPGHKGGIVAQLLSDYYGLPIPILAGVIFPSKYANINIEGYTLLNTSKWNVYIPKIVFSIDHREDKKILIIDDFVMSGDFLHSLRQKLKEYNYNDNNIKSCAVAVTQVAVDSYKNSDYYFKIVNDSGFNFPWGKAK